MRRPSARSPPPAAAMAPANSQPRLRRPLSLLSSSSTAAVALAIFLCLAFLAAGVLHHFRRRSYSIVIDGGSTGTRIHVYDFYEARGTVDLGPPATMRVVPGLSAFAEDPDGAGGSLTELVEFGKRRIPRESWATTEVRLMATAGMRRLDTVSQGRILESCRMVLRSSGFQFLDDWASVISGVDEGLYAWVAVNYALGTLGGDPKDTTGIVELGGASAQVTFVSSEQLPPELLHQLTFGKYTYNLYSNSLLHFGQNVAHESLKELLVSNDMQFSEKSGQDGKFADPCTPRGYIPIVKTPNMSTGVSNVEKREYATIYGSGNFSECRAAALMLLQKGKDGCLYKHCNIGSTFIPKLSGKFLATENFFHTSKFFGLSETAFLYSLQSAGQRFCEEDWLKLKNKYRTYNDEDLLGYCFSSAYIVALLHDSLGVSLNDERIQIANQVGNVPLDWALGAFILQKRAHQRVEESVRPMSIFNDDSPALLSLFVVSSILIFTAWFMAKWRKPQLKTIYDLEKGRYIVTHVINR